MECDLYKEGTHNIKNVTKLAFGMTILLRGIRTGIVGKGAIRIQNGEESFIMILVGII